MTTHDSALGIFDSRLTTDDAIGELLCGGMNIQRVSIVGKDHSADEHVVGCYSTGERMMYWGKRGAVCVGMWGVLFGVGFFWVPGLGPLLVAGPLITVIASPASGAAAIEGLTALGAGLYKMGLARDGVLKCEAAVKNGKFVLIYLGTPNEVQLTRDLLERTKVLETALHVRETAAVA